MGVAGRLFCDLMVVCMPFPILRICRDDHVWDLMIRAPICSTLEKK